MLKKIDVDKSTVYDNTNTKFDGLELGQKGYFSDEPLFEHYYEGQLSVLNTDNPLRYKTITYDRYTYFIPENKVVFKEEKKLRPYKDIEEFKRETKKYFSIGDILLIRERKTGCVSELLYTGNLVTDHRNIERICLGADMWTLEVLSNYDFCFNDSDWFAFGVEE